MLEKKDFLFVLTKLYGKKELIPLKNVQLYAQKHVLLLLGKRLRVNVKEYRKRLIVYSEFEHLMIQSTTGLWHTLDIRLEHNHQMVLPEQRRRFMASERELLEDVKAEIILPKRSDLKFVPCEQQNSLTVLLGSITIYTTFYIIRKVKATETLMLRSLLIH
ncbi:406_t:CDS:1 [Paraglomus occultum]|uniref:406_t:CDS:1 n=1 Tax=Paraglomus occultum TaxID=144539 RepID=A0A9N9GEP4_9GLOM|nr:406_t:CDS:1 [Paraglomus occultum]